MATAPKTVKKAPAKKKASAKKQGNLFSTIKSKLNRENLRKASVVLVDIALIVIAAHLISVYVF